MKFMNGFKVLNKKTYSKKMTDSHVLIKTLDENLRNFTLQKVADVG